MDLETLAEWRALVGETRAGRAAAVADTLWRAGWLPALLVEDFLRDRALSYRAEEVVNGVTCDFTVDTPSGIAVWCTWSSEQALAMGRAADSRIKGAVVRGKPVTAVVHLLASDIYAGTGVLEQARAGHGR